MAEVSTYYVVGGKRLPLYPVDTVRFISYQEGVDAGKLKEKIGKSKELGIDAGFPQRFVVVRGAPEALKKLYPNPDFHEIAWTRAAFRDKHGHEVILTDDVLVKLQKRDDRETLIKLLGGEKEYKVSRKPERGEVWRIRLLDPGEAAPLRLANRLSENNKVVYAEPDALQRARRCQGPQAPAQINYDPDWQWHLKKINAEEAWDLLDQINSQKRKQGVDGLAEIRVVVHDCGLAYVDHPDLAPQIIYEAGCNFDNPGASKATHGSDGHGTACAGIIGAKPPDGQKGVVGVAPNCRLVPLRATALTWSEWAETFRWAAQHGDIVSCSWSISENQTMTDAIRQVVQQEGLSRREMTGGMGEAGKQAVIFGAAGNDNKNEVCFPANLPGVIAVGACTDQDERADYSNYGPELDIMAPSSGGQKMIATTDFPGSQGYSHLWLNNLEQNLNLPKFDNYYCNAYDDTGFGGTSAATPLAAGVAALMLSINPNLTPDQVRQILCQTADQIGPDPYDRVDAYDRQIQQRRNDKYGFGRINAQAAVSETWNRAAGS